jgi:hypothetical protein
VLECDPNEINQVALIDVCGKLILLENVTSQRVEILTSHLERGIYFLKYGNNIIPLVKE